MCVSNQGLKVEATARFCCHDSSFSQFLQRIYGNNFLSDSFVEKTIFRRNELCEKQFLSDRVVVKAIFRQIESLKKQFFVGSKKKFRQNKRASIARVQFDDF